MKMDYRRDLQHNYLVAEDGEDTENYITRMMTENQVQGLLGCECRRMDQKKLYYYDITSKISLAEKCRYKKIKGSEMLLVVQGLLQVLVQLEEYLIPADRICLDWNYIYLDPASGQPSFCCLPVTEKELEQGVRELLEELLPRLDHQEQDGVSVCGPGVIFRDGAAGRSGTANAGTEKIAAKRITDVWRERKQFSVGEWVCKHGRGRAVVSRRGKKEYTGRKCPVMGEGETSG